MHHQDSDRMSTTIERDLELLRNGHQLPHITKASKLPAWWYAAILLQAGTLVLIMLSL
jgi:hypothetical protein